MNIHQSKSVVDQWPVQLKTPCRDTEPGSVQASTVETPVNLSCCSAKSRVLEMILKAQVIFLQKSLIEKGEFSVINAKTSHARIA